MFKIVRQCTMCNNTFKVIPTAKKLTCSRECSILHHDAQLARLLIKNKFETFVRKCNGTQKKSAVALYRAALYQKRKKANGL